MTKKRYTPEFKAQAVELVAIGKPVSEVAQELGIGSSLLYKWVGPIPRLRREIAHLKLERTTF